MENREQRYDWVHDIEHRQQKKHKNKTKIKTKNNSTESEEIKQHVPQQKPGGQQELLAKGKQFSFGEN